MSRKPVLSIKQTRFVAAYLVTGSAIEAAQAAGLGKPNSSRPTLSVLGYDMLQHPVVSAEIDKRKKAILAKADVSVERILQGLYAEATFYGEGSTHGARVAAWTQLGRYQQMFVDKAVVEHKHQFSDLTADELRYQITSLLEKARQIALSPPAPKTIDVTPAKPELKGFE